jgi:hypothetical protein
VESAYQNSRRPLKPSTARPGPGLRVGLRATESLVEAHAADEALEPRDKVLPGVQIPSPRGLPGETQIRSPVSTHARCRHRCADHEKIWTSWALSRYRQSPVVPHLSRGQWHHVTVRRQRQGPLANAPRPIRRRVFDRALHRLMDNERSTAAGRSRSRRPRRRCPRR